MITKPTVGQIVQQNFKFGFSFIHSPVYWKRKEAWSRHIGVGFETWVAGKEKPNSFPSK
jgi:hypothetical protein